MNRTLAAGAMLTLLLCAAQTVAAPPVKPVLTLDAAKQIAAAAVDYARHTQAPGAAIAIVDDGGQLVYLERLDNTFAAGSRISTGKARTAALFRKPTKAFEDSINKGRTAMAALDDFTPLQGGVPLIADGQLVGAVGVSGAASADQDSAIAEAAAQAAATLLASH